MIYLTEPGHLEVVSGGMFGGKSDYLIRSLQREKYARKKVVAVKPDADTRSENIKSHSGFVFTAVSVAGAGVILDLARDATVVGIDEAQFFNEDIVDVCQALVGEGKRVIVAGLDLDYRGVPFGPMPLLLAVADNVIKLHAVCTVCGSTASRSQRVVDSQEQVVIGGSTAYEARCRKHWSPEPVFSRREAMGEVDG